MNYLSTTESQRKWLNGCRTQCGGLIKDWTNEKQIEQ